ncbi:MAG TPA: VWA domain-containing protein [Gemmatimonadales bacterium]|jgi:Ca-activated chloride channel family protein
MSFAYPGLLLLAAVLFPLGFVLVVRAERSRRAQLVSFGDPAVLVRSSNLPSDRATRIRSSLGVAAVALGLLALARPQFGEREAELAQTGRDVVVVLDLSRSMNVPDVSLRSGAGRVARLTLAKRLAWETVSASPGDRVGLIVFGGGAFLQLPLTPDQATLRLFLDAASTDDLGDPATDLSAALATAAQTFEHEGERGRRAILVVSDGESGEGDLNDAIARVRRLAIPVFTIGVGTRAGAPVPADSSEAPEPFHRDNIGRIAISRLQEEDLRHVAAATGGTFARWDRPLDLRQLTASLGKVRVRTLSSQKSRERADRFQWPLGAAVLLLGWESWMGRTRRTRRTGRTPQGGGTRRTGRTVAGSAVALVLLTLIGCAGDAGKGDRLYQAGNYHEAYDAYRRALAKDSTPQLVYQTGNALYRLRRYDDAADRFRQATWGPEQLRQRSFYNLGNALVRAAEETPESNERLHRAVAAYEEALRLDPADADAKWNLELALRRLGDDRTSGGSRGRGRSADYGRGNMNQPDYEGNREQAVGAMAGGGFGSGEGESVEQLDEEQARRLLDAVQREQLTTHEGKRLREPTSGGPDW